MYYCSMCDNLEVPWLQVKNVENDCVPAVKSISFPLLFSKVTRGESVDDCELCDLGHYCNRNGSTDVAGVCDPGYFCLRGAKIPKPNNDSTGGICPRGSSCLAGQQPEKCQPGNRICFQCLVN